MTSARPHYASGTDVSVEKSRAELDALLKKHGATQRGIFEDDERSLALVIFSLGGRQYRLEVPLPTRASIKVERRNYRRTEDQQQIHMHEQACRERWRSVLLLVKAKLEAVAIGLSTTEREFLADLMLPNGKRLHAMLTEQIAKSYLDGGMPKLLGLGSDNDDGEETTR